MKQRREEKCFQRLAAPEAEADQSDRRDDAERAGEHRGRKPKHQADLEEGATNSALSKKARYHFKRQRRRREIEVRARAERHRDHDHQRRQQQHVGQRHEGLQQRGHLAIHVPCSWRPVRRVIASAMKESDVVAITSKVAIADALGH